LEFIISPLYRSPGDVDAARKQEWLSLWRALRMNRADRDHQPFHDIEIGQIADGQ